MRVYDLSPTPDRYYRQNGSGPGRNEIDPGVTCKPTATVMGLDVAGWPVPGHGAPGFDPLLCMYRQPEDNLTALCRSHEAYAYKVAIDAGLKDTPGNEVWAVVAWAVKHLYGFKPFNGPRWDWGLREALWGIARHGRPFVPSTWLTGAGHVVMLAGYITEQEQVPATYLELDLDAVKEIIVDDPAGLHLPAGGYNVERSGYHQRYSLSDWRQYWRGIGIQILRKEA